MTDRLWHASPVGGLVLTAADDRLTALGWQTRPFAAHGEPAPVLAEAVRQLDAYFAGRLRRFDLPLTIAGEPLQEAVWQAMCAIPYGETRTYGDLAQALGSNARAVGGVCGTNPIAIVVPCHRVMGAGGTLVGYSGGQGTETKRHLLQLEGALLL